MIQSAYFIRMQCMAHIAINRSSYGSIIAHRINITHHITSQMGLCSVFSLQRDMACRMYILVFAHLFVLLLPFRPTGYIANYMTFCLFQPDYIDAKWTGKWWKTSNKPKMKCNNTERHNSKKVICVQCSELMAGIINKNKIYTAFCRCISPSICSMQYASQTNRILTQDF